jgi:hypothetical protein
MKGDLRNDHGRKLLNSVQATPAEGLGRTRTMLVCDSIAQKIALKGTIGVDVLLRIRQILPLRW